MKRTMCVRLVAAGALCVVMGCTEADSPALPNSAPSNDVTSDQDSGSSGGEVDLHTLEPALEQEGGEAADTATEVHSQNVTELMAMGVVLSDGYAPHAHLGRTDGILNWPPPDATPEAIGNPPVPEELGPLEIHAAVEHYPLSCVEYTRTITAVNVGDSKAEQEIARQIQQVAHAEHRDFQSWFSTEEDCADISGDLAGNTYQELLEEPCQLPEGPPLRCFLLADFGYPPAAAHTYLIHHQLVFETETGQRLLLDDLFQHAGLEPNAARETAASIVQAITRDVVEPTIRQARPELEVLVLEFSPYEAGPFAAGTRRVVIPWNVFQLERMAEGQH